MIFLEHGLNDKNEMIHISSVQSGKTDLICPFCKIYLTAVKGRVKNHHFRHEGVTCADSSGGLSVDKYHKFDFGLTHADWLKINELDQIFEGSGLNYRYDNIQLLDSFFKHSRLESKNVLQFDSVYRDHYVYYRYTPWFLRSRDIASGSADFKSFADWFDAEIDHDLNLSRSDGFNHYRINVDRVKFYATGGLYVFKYRAYYEGDSVGFLKIGRTNRDPAVRLDETINDLKKQGYTDIDSSILLFNDNAGFIEQYALHKYAKFARPVGKHREYFNLHAMEGLVNDFKKIAGLPQSSPMVSHCQVVQKIHNRNRAIKAKLQKMKREGVTLGRPAGRVSMDDYFKKHKKIVRMLSKGKKTSEILKSGAGCTDWTIRKIKRRMISAGLL